MFEIISCHTGQGCVLRLPATAASRIRPGDPSLTRFRLQGLGAQTKTMCSQYMQPLSRLPVTADVYIPATCLKSSKPTILGVPDYMYGIMGPQTPL